MRKSLFKEAHNFFSNKANTYAKTITHIDNIGNLSLSEHVEMEQRFKWYSAFTTATEALYKDANKKEFLPLFSSMHKNEGLTKLKEFTQEFNLSSTVKEDRKNSTHPNALISALEDLEALIDIAGRDFEKSYKEPHPTMLDFLSQHYDMPLHDIKDAIKEESNKQQTQILREIRSDLKVIKQRLLGPITSKPKFMGPRP